MQSSDPSLSRRKFIAATTVAAGAAALASQPLAGFAESFYKPAGPVTVGQIMDAFISEVPTGPVKNTVDTLKSGNRDIVVTGVLTTMFATIDNIKKAIGLGANFIIAHEPTFYNHEDQVDWLQQSDVYQYKADLLKKHNIAVWRNHDHIHSLKEDGVRAGLVKKLGWEKYGTDKFRWLFNLPGPQSVQQLISFTKGKLDIEKVRYVGDLQQSCQKVLFMVGAAGGRRQIQALMDFKPDILITGEISEWETAEYVRDAQQKGDKLALVVTGHIASEEPGSEFMKEWLNQHFPAIKVTHVPPGNSLKFA